MNMEIITSIKSKADAIVFAINKASEHTEAFDKGKVDEIYNYILSKVDLPDIERDVNDGYINALGGIFDKYTNILEGMSVSQEQKI